jgi:hypothetical protein
MCEETPQKITKANQLAQQCPKQATGSEREMVAET